MLFKKEQLEAIVKEMFARMGASDAEQEILTEEIVASDLCGVDSHGIRNVTLYANLVKMGVIIPNSPVTVEKETDTTFVVNAHNTFGHIGARKAVEIAAEKAKKHGVAVGTTLNLCHVGRLGSYTDYLAKQGLISFIMCGLYIDKQSAPFGASETRFGTNPYSWGAPRKDGPNVVLDMATTAVAESKVRGYYQTKTPVPSSWIVDADGNPSTDPAVIYEAREDGTIGSLQPVGGHKGSGMALFANLFGIALANEFYAAPTKSLNGLFVVAVDPDAFYGQTAFNEMSKATCEYVKSAKPKAGGPAVLVPGELEALCYARRSVEGVEIPQGNLDVIVATAKELGCEWPSQYGL